MQVVHFSFRPSRSSPARERIPRSPPRGQTNRQKNRVRYRFRASTRKKKAKKNRAWSYRAVKKDRKWACRKVYAASKTSDAGCHGRRYPQSRNRRRRWLIPGITESESERIRREIGSSNPAAWIPKSAAPTKNRSVAYFHRAPRVLVPRSSAYFLS